MLFKACNNCKYLRYDYDFESETEFECCDLDIFGCPNKYSDDCYICSVCPYKSMCEADTLAEMVKNG